MREVFTKLLYDRGYRVTRRDYAPLNSKCIKGTLLEADSGDHPVVCVLGTSKRNARFGTSRSYDNNNSCFDVPGTDTFPIGVRVNGGQFVSCGEEMARIVKAMGNPRSDLPFDVLLMEGNNDQKILQAKFLPLLGKVAHSVIVLQASEGAMVCRMRRRLDGVSKPMRDLIKTAIGRGGSMTAWHYAADRDGGYPYITESERKELQAKVDGATSQAHRKIVQELQRGGGGISSNLVAIGGSSTFRIREETRTPALDKAGITAATRYLAAYAVLKLGNHAATLDCSSQTQISRAVEYVLREIFL